MTAEAARLKRLTRLEWVRALARQDALRAAAEAEGHLAQLQALAERTERLAADYRARRDCASGADLRWLSTFAEGIAAIGSATTRDALAARAAADQRQLDLAQAERSHAAVEERARSEAQKLASQRVRPVLAARKAIGTGLEK